SPTHKRGPAAAVGMHRHWNVLRVNEGSARVQAAFLDPKAVAELGPPNAMRLMFHPNGFRPYIVNWEATAASLIQWLHRDAASGRGDDETRRLLQEVLADPEETRPWASL